MSNVSIVRYDLTQKQTWDNFVSEAKNGIFLFYRDYMDYHSDRFPDFSLMGFDDSGSLVGILPATLQDNRLASHAGLTYGGVVCDHQMKASLMLSFFDSLKEFLISNQVATLQYKTIPHIFHRLPCEEDLYALFRNGAQLVRRDLSSAILFSNKLPFSKGRRYSIKVAEKSELEVERSYDFETFMSLKTRTLDEKYGVKPTHTASEMQLLADRFPDNIKLFVSNYDGEMVAGVLVYEHPTAVHAQYIAASETGKKLGALDLIIDSLLESYASSKTYFDFGISTDDAGKYLNTGLVQNKEGFGARAIVHDFYELDLT
jgi:Acetyltransferase (GNAT) domain